MKTTSRSALLGICVFAALASAAQAQIIANFSGGQGTASYDQYAGRAGGGWTNAWQENNTVDITATVTNADPFLSTPGGNYLSVSVADPEATGFDLVSRSYSSDNGVSLTAAHTLSFDFRLDSPASEMTTGDAIVFFNHVVNPPVLGGTNGFEIRGFISNSIFQWTWSNGNKAGSATRVNSGMSIVTGTEYHFTLDLLPETKDWTVSIYDGTTTVSSGILGYRTGAAAPVTLPVLAFGVVDVDTVTPDTITYSLNDIIIAVPEPSVSVLLTLGGAFVIFCRRLRSRADSAR
jgi:hypothetical protein